MERDQELQDAGNYRAFSREPMKAPIAYAIHAADAYRPATMYNQGKGGMYFETPVMIPDGSDLFIRLSHYSPERHGQYDIYRAEVMWCSPINRNGDILYGIGVRFLINECQGCGETIPYTEICRTEDNAYLCPACASKIESMDDGKLRELFCRYLDGNVI